SRDAHSGKRYEVPLERRRSQEHRIRNPPAGELGLHDHARIVQADGLTAVREAAHDYEGEPTSVLVHLDPFDPYEETAPGVSAITLAAELRDRDFKVFYWYGFELPERRAWPW